MSVLIKIVRSRVGFFSSLCTRLAGRRSLTGRCSCWAVDWKCCHREQGKGEVAGLWQSELEMEEAFCHLHRAVTQLNVGENVWIWVLNLILCSPGWEVCKGSCSAHMDGIVLPHHCYLMMLSWLTLRESPWFKREGQHKTILFRIQGEKAGDTPFTKPPCVTSLCHLPVSSCIYMHYFWHPTKMFIHQTSSVSLGGTQAATKIVYQCSWMCLFPAVAGLNAAMVVAELHPHFSYLYELRGGHYNLLQLIFI